MLISIVVVRMIFTNTKKHVKKQELLNLFVFSIGLHRLLGAPPRV